MKTTAHRASYVFGSYRADASRRLLLRQGQPVPISAKAFDVLLFLIENRERVVGKEELLASVWSDAVVEEANLVQCVSVLRKSLGEKPGENVYIATVPGKGYQFASVVQETEAVLPPEPSRHPWTLGKPRWLHWVTGITLAGAFATAVVMKSRTPQANQAGTQGHRLTSWRGEETQPAFSPDGNQIAFTASGESGENQDIYVALPGTGSTLRLTTDPASDSSPAWSPDGKYIAFYRGPPHRAYYLIPAIGGAERKLVDADPPGKSIGRKLTWSPDGAFLVISERAKLDAPRELIAIALATGEKRILTHPPVGTGDEDPAFSPDGSKLAFVRDFVRVYVAQPDGGQPRSIAVVPGIRGLAWSADSKHLLFADMRTSGPNLWKVPFEGGRPEPVTATGGGIAFPAISPDGRKLAYSEFRQNENIWRLGIDGHHKDGLSDTRLIASSKAQFSPQLSPDSQKIVFVSDRTGNREIWVCNSDGENSRQLTFMGGAHNGTPRWSPDSRTIIFDSLKDGRPDVFAISIEGGTPRNLTNHAAADITPSYSRDGHWIYFSSSRSGAMEIWRMPSSGGAATQITRKGGMSPIESFDGGALYYSKGGENPGVWRVPTSGGVESLVVPGVSYWGWWTLTESGIYFLELDASANTKTLKFASFAGVVSSLRRITANVSVAENVLNADRTGRTLLLEQIDDRAADLMIVELAN